MDTDPSFEARYRAVRSRDTRFDGRFFTGVTSTGIYCRPICPARIPRRENVRFYRFAAAAERDGFRPCRRCRPGVGPESSDWDRRGDLVGRALRLIADGVVDRDGVRGLATRLGTSERHLQRLVRAEVGVTPGVLARSRRATLARRLLVETDLDVTTVAFAAGFSSIRAFNETVRAVHGASPTELRATRSTPPAGGLHLTLAARPPFDGPRLLAHLSARAVAGVEHVEGTLYRRGAVVGETAVAVEVDVGDDRVVMRIPAGTATPVGPITRAVRRVFDLDADPVTIDADLASGGGPLAALVRRRPGLRLPGAFDGFEAAVRAVLSQQVSLAAAATHAGRLVVAHGTPLDEPLGAVTHAFPTAETLAEADLSSLMVPRTRRIAVRALARAVADGRLALDGSAPDADVVDGLLALPGVGPWTAAVVAVRVLRDPDAFPASDLGLREMLGHGGRRASATEAGHLAAAWRPWRAYAAQHLWTELAERETTP